MTTTSTPNTPVRERRKPQSQLGVAWQQFRRNRLAQFGGVVLILLYVMAVFAGFLAPDGLSNYSTTNITRFHVPTPIHVRDPKTGAWVGPYVNQYTLELDQNTFKNVYKPSAERCPIRFFVRGDTYSLLGIRSNVHLFGTGNEDCKAFIWGGDALGRDLFTRIMYASQISLTIGLGAALLSTLIAVVLGTVAAYFQGWADVVIMRLVEVISAIPFLFLLILLRAMFPANVNPILALYIVIFLLAFISWGGLARVLRGAMLSVREQDYVSAATALGARNNRIMFRHMLPSMTTYLIVELSLVIPGYILLESGLSFLGIGAVEPYASWGSLLNQAQEGGFSSITERPWVLISGFFIVVTVMCFQLLGDGLRDAFDPRKRR